MKRLLITTFFLLCAAVAITVVYFKNLNLPGKHPASVLQAIPNDAVLIFEFNNDDSFYEIFNGNTLLPAIIGKEKIAELNALRQQLINEPSLKSFFDQQHLFISLHPEKNGPGFLLTSSVGQGFRSGALDALAKKTGGNMMISEITLGGKPAYNIYLKDLKKSFYLAYKGDHILSGSFSKDLAGKSAGYVEKKDDHDFTLLPDQQSSNSLANLYVNYKQLAPLSDLFFNNRYNDIFKNFRSLPAFAALSLNFKNDALMFSGFTSLQSKEADSYLDLFRNQQPVVNQLKDIFPSTTAYSITFSVSDVLRFEKSLIQFQHDTKVSDEKSALFSKVKSETGINLNTEFNNLLSNEFAVVTTRYQEKLAIISVKNGSQLRPFMVNVSNMVTDERGQLKYNKLPFFLLGDAFSWFSKPYFMILDNYLILANTDKELSSYLDSYTNHKLLSKIKEQNDFESMISERTNVAFFIQFKNAQPIFKRDLKSDLFDLFENNQPGWKNYYAASYQFTASDKDYYTNFCMSLNKKDSTEIAPATR